jgi:hypothetical protein
MIEVILTAVLGVALPASEIRVPTAVDPHPFSVQFFDNKREELRGKSVTNAVLDRTIREDVVRVHTDANTAEVHANRAQKNQAAVEEHCQKRLVADSIPNAARECGPGYSKNADKLR